ncbi:neuroguidin [Ditylenchus destructor]|uniref:Neuroguidin n=1 Tax=Ditylenchus destructor TaxID=166010 RepID=A0AAD4N2Z4_9BILA|nr:neuroguidin [Ditylenchus destructor]
MSEKPDDSATLKQVLSECCNNSERLLAEVKKFASFLAEQNNETSANSPEGTSLLDVKNMEMLDFIIDSLLQMARTDTGESMKGQDVRQLIKNRAVRKKIPQAENKLKNQIKTQTNLSNEDAAEKSLHSKKSAQIQQTKIAPLHEEERRLEETKTRRLEKLKKRAQKSSLWRELHQQLSDKPEEIRESEFLPGGNSKRSKQKYEEEFFMRLPESKQQRHLEKKKRERGEIGNLLSFGKYNVDEDEAVEGGKPKRRRQDRGPGRAKFNNKRKRGSGKNGPR